MKHGGGSIMQWGRFSACGTVNLTKVEGIMKEEGYMKCLKENLKQSGTKLDLHHHFVFRHFTLLVKNYF